MAPKSPFLPVLPLALALSLGLASGCSAPPHDPKGLDPWLRSGLPTPTRESVLLSPDHSLWTDRGPALAAALDQAASVEIAEVARLFQSPLPTPLLIETRSSTPALEAMNLRGYTAAKRHVVLLLPLDASDPELVDSFRKALRHELAHLASEDLLANGPTPADWLSEGIAHYVEGMRSGPNGTLRPPAALALLRKDRALPLAAVLDWHSDAQALFLGQSTPHPELRRMATAFLAFLLEKAPPERSFPERLLAIAARDRRSLLTEEAAFRKWLATAS